MYQWNKNIIYSRKRRFKRHGVILDPHCSSYCPPIFSSSSLSPSSPHPLECPRLCQCFHFHCYFPLLCFLLLWFPIKHLETTVIVTDANKVNLNIIIICCKVCFCFFLVKNDQQLIKWYSRHGNTWRCLLLRCYIAANIKNIST